MPVNKSKINKWLAGATMGLLVGLGSTAASAAGIYADFNAGNTGSATYSPTAGALYQATSITSFGSGITINSLDATVDGYANAFVTNGDPTAGSSGGVYGGSLSLAPGTGVFQTTNIANFLTFGSKSQYHFKLTGYEITARVAPGTLGASNYLDISMIGVFTDTTGVYATQNASLAWSGQQVVSSGGGFSYSVSFTTPPTFTPPSLPDPAPLLLIGLGAIIMVGMRHRARA